MRAFQLSCRARFTSVASRALVKLTVRDSLQRFHNLNLAFILLSPLVLFLGSNNQILGWGPILVSLQVPELTMEEFLQECLSLGSYLTLYVYLLQCLNSEQTLRNEMKVLLLISKWSEQVYPRWVGPRAAVSYSLALDNWEVGGSKCSFQCTEPSETNKRGREVQGRFFNKDFYCTC